MIVKYILNIVLYIEYRSKSCLIHRLVQLIINQQKLVLDKFDSRDVRCQMFETRLLIVANGCGFDSHLCSLLIGSWWLHLS